ncbi:MAG TPA: SCO family protein [Steroidobacteraceae bacterium]|nr:SCO family protein [Steroidobacteraceae bacterium]
MTARSKLMTLVLLAVAAAGGLLAARLLSPRPPAMLTTGTLLAPPRPLADFSLIDNQGRPFGPANLRGHWSMMFFGYTHCPDFCPATLTLLAAVKKQLRAAKSVALPQVIFVSVDAKRDTPAQLNRYVPNFDPEFIGLTAADQPSIERIARTWGVAAAIQPTPNGDYIVDHSEAIFVIDPAGNLAAVLTGPFTVDALQSDFRRIVTARA